MARMIIEAIVAAGLLALAAGTAAAQCPGDANGNGFVNFADYGAVAQNFGQACSPETRFVDNGNGTITDRWRGLTWEKLSDDLSVHDKDTLYFGPDASSVKIAALNGTEFAGYSNWRLPSISELQSLIDYGSREPSIFDPFNDGCTLFCTVLSCSCTLSAGYWSASDSVADARMAWFVNFEDGATLRIPKDTSLLGVRAVRDATSSPPPTATPTPAP